MINRPDRLPAQAKRQNKIHKHIWKTVLSVNDIHSHLDTLLVQIVNENLSFVPFLPMMMVMMMMMSVNGNQKSERAKKENG